MVYCGERSVYRYVIVALLSLFGGMAQASTNDANVAIAAQINAQITIITKTTNASIFATTGDRQRVLDGLTSATNNVQLLLTMAEADPQAAWFLQKVATVIGDLGQQLQSGATMAPLLAPIFLEGGVDTMTNEVRTTPTVVTSALFPLIVSRQIFYDIALAVSRIPTVVQVDTSSLTAVPDSTPVAASHKSKLSGGAIAGIVIGTVVGVVGLGALAWAGARHYGKKNEKKRVKSVDAGSVSGEGNSNGSALLQALPAPRAAATAVEPKGAISNASPIVTASPPKPSVRRVVLVAPQPAAATRGSSSDGSSVATVDTEVVGDGSGTEGDGDGGRSVAEGIGASAGGGDDQDASGVLVTGESEDLLPRSGVVLASPLERRGAPRAAAPVALKKATGKAPNSPQSLSVSASIVAVVPDEAPAPQIASQARFSAVIKVSKFLAGLSAISLLFIGASRSESLTAFMRSPRV